MLFDEFMKLNGPDKHKYIQKILFEHGLDNLKVEQGIMAFIESLDKRSEKKIVPENSELLLNSFEINSEDYGDNGLFINGQRIKSIQDVKLHSDLDDITTLTVTMLGRMRGLDDLKGSGYVFKASERKGE